MSDQPPDKLDTSFRIEDIDTTWLYEHGIQRGSDVGYRCLEDIWSLKKSSTLFVIAPPTHGKSEFMMQILLNMSKFYGWKHAIYSPETGEPKDIVAELASKFVGRDYYKGYDNQMSIPERDRALEFLNEHFVILDSNERLTLNGFYNEVDKAEEEHKFKFDTTLIDPWSKIKHEKAGRRDDEYLQDVLDDHILNARRHKRLNIITSHPRDQQTVTRDGITYYPAPTPREYANGQEWYKNGFNMIGLWRVPKGMRDEHGVEYPDNALQFETHKCKPKGIAKPGMDRQKVILYYDAQKHQYYEHSPTAGKLYAEKRREETIEQQPPQVDI